MLTRTDSPRASQGGGAGRQPATEWQASTVAQFIGNSPRLAQTRQTHPGAAEPMPPMHCSLWRPGRAPALSVRLVRPIVTLLCLFALSLPAAQLAAADRDRDEEPYADLPQSVRRIERETGGKVLQVRPIRRGDREIYRMKVLTPDGRIKIMQDDPRRRRDSRNREDPRKSEDNETLERERGSPSRPSAERGSAEDEQGFTP